MCHFCLKLHPWKAIVAAPWIWLLFYWQIKAALWSSGPSLWTPVQEVTEYRVEGCKCLCWECVCKYRNRHCLCSRTIWWTEDISIQALLDCRPDSSFEAATSGVSSHSRKRKEINEEKKHWELEESGFFGEANPLTQWVVLLNKRPTQKQERISVILMEVGRDSSISPLLPG